jgi:site-specific DNA-cytosine methylase
MVPFIKLEADALLTAGYQDLGWREVSSEALGVPNSKTHVILVATAKELGVVDACLFSTVRQ